MKGLSSWNSEIKSHGLIICCMLHSAWGCASQTAHKVCSRVGTHSSKLWPYTRNWTKTRGWALFHEWVLFRETTVLHFVGNYAKSVYRRIGNLCGQEIFTIFAVEFTPRNIIYKIIIKSKVVFCVSNWGPQWHPKFYGICDTLECSTLPTSTKTMHNKLHMNFIEHTLQKKNEKICSISLL